MSFPFVSYPILSCTCTGIEAKYRSELKKCALIILVDNNRDLNASSEIDKILSYTNIRRVLSFVFLLLSHWLCQQPFLHLIYIYIIIKLYLISILSTE